LRKGEAFDGTLKIRVKEREPIALIKNNQDSLFFIFLYNAPSYWLTLNKICDDEFHLASDLAWIKKILRRFPYWLSNWLVATEV
jgi:hypothetical protein